MRITCPACSTSYTVADTSVKPQGRKVKCAKCGHIWVQKQPAAKAPPPPPPPRHQSTVTEDDLGQALAALRAHPPSDDDDDDFNFDFTKSSSAATAKKSRASTGRRRASGLTWAVLTLVVVVISAAGVLARESVIGLWPPSALLYDTIGLPVDPPGAGLTLRGVKSEQRQEKGVPFLFIEGQIANTTEQVRRIPRLRAVTLGAEHQLLQEWLFDASAPQLLPGEVATFNAAQRDPGPVTEVTVSLDGGLP
jgi:predicted Zn finger-like uncharacterized protein